MFFKDVTLDNEIDVKIERYAKFIRHRKLSAKRERERVI
jgi:hypothetical protein